LNKILDFSNFKILLAHCLKKKNKKNTLLAHKPAMFDVQNITLKTTVCSCHLKLFNQTR